MEFGTVYRLWNTVNGKSYVGQTIKPIAWYINRKLTHRATGCPKLSNAIEKYEKESFEYEVLVECPHSELSFWEIHYIEFYDCINNGYNVSSGGEGGNNFAGKSDEEMSDIGNKISDNHARLSGVNSSFWGKTHSDDSKSLMSDKSKGYWSDPANRKEQSDRKKEYWSDANKRKEQSEKAHNTGQMMASAVSSLIKAKDTGQTLPTVRNSRKE